MYLKDEVIVFNTILYKEKSLILNTYSKLSGTKSFFLSQSEGKSKRKDRNNYQPFSVLELVSSNKTKGSLPKVTESKNIHLFLSIRSSIGKNAMSFLLCEILSKCIQEEEHNLSLYEFIEEKIITLETCQNSFANFHLHFICQLTKHLGICPNRNGFDDYFDIKEGVFTKEIPPHHHYLKTQETRLFLQLLFEPWESVQNIKLSGGKRSYLLGELLKYFQYHVPGFEQPKSLAILNEVFQC